jgi:LysR family hydrogen peroxide-inducible transcriptional activator
VLLTDLGNEVVALAREALCTTDRITERVAARRAPLSGRLRLGSVSTITPYLAPQLMADAPRRFPHTEFRLLDGVADVLEAKLVQGELDALVVPLPTGLPGCEEVDLAFDPFVLAVPDGSPLAKLGEPLERDALAGQELLLLEDPHCLRRQILDTCTPLGAGANGAIHATSLHAIVQLVRRGIGATLLPALAIPLELESAPGVQLIRFADPPPGRRIGLAWRRGSPREEGFRELAAELRGHCLALLD